MNEVSQGIHEVRERAMSSRRISDSGHNPLKREGGEEAVLKEALRRSEAMICGEMKRNLTLNLNLTLIGGYDL